MTYQHTFGEEKLLEKHDSRHCEEQLDILGFTLSHFVALDKK